VNYSINFLNDILCPICGLKTLVKEDSHPYPNTDFRSTGPKRILFCFRCGLGIGYPLLSDEELDQLYNGAEFWAQSNQKLSVKRQPVLHALAKSRWSFIISNLPKSLQKKNSLALLDIGAGYGYLGLVASKASEKKINKYTAVEPDRNLHSALEAAWCDCCAELDIETLSTIDQVNGKFDIVALSHVVEHVKYPLVFIAKAVSYLTEEGVLFVEVPNRDDLFKSSVFPHLLFFSPKSLESLLKKMSLDMITIEAWGKSYKNSPLNKNAPLIIRSVSKFLSLVARFLPSWLASLLVANLFGINKRHPQGTWIRVMACK